MLYCPIELASISIKILADLIVTFTIEDADDAKSTIDENNFIPPQLQRLLAMANEKADITVEEEIMRKFLFSSKKILEDKLSTLIHENHELR